MNTHFLRNKFNHRTIVDIDVTHDDLSCVVDIEHYTSFLDQISDEKERVSWISDMSAIQEIRGEYHEIFGIRQKYTPNEFVKHRCKELAEKWKLYYVVD